ncbi:superoxide dismutase [uncultured Clostridium sp.]|uniref:superoxide dismutase n=1 Tax=uncultured Clostridium sp. TaxID=59620 RepID=UPI002673D9F9|nr:superoxide dismutase [uncultured Clostridium sp.]
MKYEKIYLPYLFNALEPYIDKETVEIHYTKHLQGYVDNLNKVLKGYEDFTKGKTLEDILMNPKKIPKEIREKVITNGGGVYNHNLYFSILYPKPKRKPEGKLMDRIKKQYGSFEQLRELINENALNRFGSGYSFLVKEKYGRLHVMNTLNQDTPLICGFKPILCIDVWEHAYYLKYKNLRGKYLENIWQIINWAKVEELYNGKV